MVMAGQNTCSRACLVIPSLSRRMMAMISFMLQLLLPGPDSVGLVDGTDEDLAIADVSRISRLQNHLNDPIHVTILQHHQEDQLGEFLIVCASNPESLLFAPAENMRLGEGGKPSALEGQNNIVFLLRPYDGPQHFHEDVYLSIQASRSDRVS